MNTRQKYEAMNRYRIEKADLSDGAFFALAEQLHGWTTDDWYWFQMRKNNGQPIFSTDKHLKPECAP